MTTANQEQHYNHTLTLSGMSEVRERLNEKLDEYDRRIEAYKQKYQVRKLGIVIDRESNMLDAIYKSEIVRSLLEKGEADLQEVHDALYEEFNGYVSEEIFMNAVSVINDYINTGGKHTSGGSGFFTDEMFKRLLQDSAVLEMPTETGRRAVIQAKYYEYLGRNVEFEQHADTTVDRAAMKRNSYRMKILAKLLSKHRLFVRELAAGMRDEEGGTFDKIEFYNALGQIQKLLKQTPSTAS